MILDGKIARDNLLLKLKNHIEENSLDITLAIIYVGYNFACEQYIKNKKKYSEKIGIKTLIFNMEESSSYEDIKNKIISLNNDDSITGIIVQFPLPNRSMEDVVEYIDPQKDVDAFTLYHKSLLEKGCEKILPCTVKGILELLNYYNISLTGKKVCILGRGPLVGKPLALALKNRGVDVDVCHSKTVDLKSHTKESDIIISAVGKPNILSSDMIDNHPVIIDVGISYLDGKQKGDTDFDNLINLSDITPNPGGVGPMTIYGIMANLVYLKERK